jgi:hypothetical protein
MSHVTLPRMRELFQTEVTFRIYLVCTYEYTHTHIIFEVEVSSILHQEI